MKLQPTDCRHTPAATAEGRAADPGFPQEPAQVEARLGNVLDKIEAKYERRLKSFLREQEKTLKDGYETHSGTRKAATDHAWVSTERILTRVFQRLFESGVFRVPLPTLSANRSGTIDITWRTDELDLLVNVPAEAGEEVEYSYSRSSGSPAFGKQSVDGIHELLTLLLADLR